MLVAISCGGATSLDRGDGGRTQDASLEPAPTDCPAAPLGAELGPLFGPTTPCDSVRFPLPDYNAVVVHADAGRVCSYHEPHILLSGYLISVGDGVVSEDVWANQFYFTCYSGTVMVGRLGTGFPPANPICPGNVVHHQPCQPPTDLGNGECVVPSEKNDIANGVVDGQVCACDMPGPVWRCVAVSQLPVPPFP
jgi:hypothetical protein